MFLFPHIVYFGCVISLYLSVHEYNVVEIEYSTSSDLSHAFGI